MEDVFEFNKVVTYKLTYPEGKTKDNVVKVIWKPTEGGYGYGKPLIVFDDGSEVDIAIDNSLMDLNKVIVIWEK